MMGGSRYITDQSKLTPVINYWLHKWLSQLMRRELVPSPVWMDKFLKRMPGHTLEGQGEISQARSFQTEMTARMLAEWRACHISRRRGEFSVPGAYQKQAL